MNLTKTSILISCKKPRELSEFYSFLTDSNVSDAKSENFCELKDESSCQMSFYKPSSKSDFKRIQPPKLAVCFQKYPSNDPKSVLVNWITDVVVRGGKLIEGPILESFGAEAWMADEEDNMFVIFVPYKTS